MFHRLFSKLVLSLTIVTTLLAPVASLAAPTTAPPASVPAATAPTSTTAAAPAASPAPTASPAPSAGDKKCDQGPMSWIFCPIMDKLQETITDIVTKFVEPMLKVNVITPSSTPSLHQAWGHVRDLANVLLILIFLVIVGANVLSFGLDSYSIKRALPRLVVAAIAVQFSFAISSLLVDLSNIAGAGIGSFIQGTTQASSAGGGVSTIAENMTVITVVAVAGFIAAVTSAALIIPLLVGFLIGIFAFFLTLGARLLLVTLMIVIAPLAIIAYVLPNTQSYYKQWFKLFTRLLLMYPIIMGLLGVAGRVNEILSFSTDGANNTGSSLAISILKPFIFLYLFTLIPKTFKWAGSWMGDFSNIINKYRDQGIKKNKEAQYYKDGQQRRRDRQLEYSRRLASSKAITSLQKKGPLGRAASSGAMRAGGFALGGAPSTGLAFNRAYSKQTNDYKKELDDLTAANNPANLHTAVKAAFGNNPADKRKLATEAPSLMHYTQTEAGRMAMFAKLADGGFTTNEDFDQVKNSTKHQNEYGLALAAAGKSYGKQPGVIPRLTENKSDYEIQDSLKRKLPDVDLPAGVTHAREIGDVDIQTTKGIVSRWSAAALSDDEKVSAENFKVAASNTKAGLDFSYVISEAAQLSELTKAYTPGHRNFMGMSKRLDGLRMLAVHKPVFANGRGEQVKDVILEHLQLDKDLLIEGLQVANGMDRAAAVALASSDPARAEAEIKRWIG